MRSNPVVTVRRRPIPPEGLVTLSRFRRVGLAGIFHPAALQGSPFADLLPDAGETHFYESPAFLPFPHGAWHRNDVGVPRVRLQGIHQSVRSVQAAGGLVRAAQTILPWASPPQGSAFVGITAGLTAAAGFQLSAPLLPEGNQRCLPVWSANALTELLRAQRPSHGFLRLHWPMRWCQSQPWLCVRPSGR